MADVAAEATTYSQMHRIKMHVAYTSKCNVIRYDLRVVSVEQNISSIAVSSFRWTAISSFGVS